MGPSAKTVGAAVLALGLATPPAFAHTQPIDNRPKPTPSAREGDLDRLMTPPRSTTESSYKRHRLGPECLPSIAKIPLEDLAPKKGESFESILAELNSRLSPPEQCIVSKILSANDCERKLILDDLKERAPHAHMVICSYIERLNALHRNATYADVVREKSLVEILRDLQPRDVIPLLLAAVGVAAYGLKRPPSSKSS